MIQFRKYHHPACNCLTFRGTLLEKFSHSPKLPSNYLCQPQHLSSEGFILNRSSSNSSLSAALVASWWWFVQSFASFWIESFSTTDSIHLLATSLCRRCQRCWPYLSLLLCECATNVLGSGRTGTSSTAKTTISSMRQQTYNQPSNRGKDDSVTYRTAMIHPRHDGVHKSEINRQQSYNKPQIILSFFYFPLFVYIRLSYRGK